LEWILGFQHKFTGKSWMPAKESNIIVKYDEKEYIRSFYETYICNNPDSDERF